MKAASCPTPASKKYTGTKVVTGSTSTVKTGSDKRFKPGKK
jgi:hypothetical protein